MNTAIGSPLRVFSGRQPDTMPPTVTSSPPRAAGIGAARLSSSAVRHFVRCALKIGDGPGAELAQIRRVRIDRVAGPEEADCFLLGVEQLDVAPRRRLGQGCDAVILVTLGAAAKQRTLSELLIALHARAVIHGRVESRHQTRPEHARW